jgi:tetratricopeptide (TPR) repeat protein
MLGSTYFMMDETKQAFSAWEQGIALVPANVVAYRVMANYAIENRAFEKAIDILERGKKIADDPTIFSLDLANIFAANMRFADAANEYCSLLKSRPDQISVVKSRIASYLQRQGSEEPTISTIKKFVNENPLPQMLDLLTYVYSTIGIFNEAFPFAVEYDKKTTGTGDYIFIFAQDAFRAKNFDAAAKAYNYVIKNYSSSRLIPIAKIGYANTLAESVKSKFAAEKQTWKPFEEPKIFHEQDYITAINAFDQLAKEFPDNAIYPQAIFSMAKIYKDNLHDYKTADSLFSIVSKNHSSTNYGTLSNIERGKIAIASGKINEAKIFFGNAAISTNVLPNDIAEANYFLARIEFWNGHFENSLKLFKNVTRDLSADFTNDALELSSIISIGKRDSLNLFKYAQADLCSFQNKFKDAANAFKTLADNPNLFILNEFANLKFAEMLIAENDLPVAVKILEVLSDSSKTAIFADKSLFLLAQCYQFGIKDGQKAIQNYQKLLEKFPNSLYFDRARDCLKDLQTKNG